jgi:hypothetical protein
LLFENSLTLTGDTFLYFQNMSEEVRDDKHRHYTTTQEILIQIAGILTVIPLAPFLCRFIPPIMIGDFNIDLILAVIFSLVVIRFFIWLVRPMVLPGFILMMAILTFNGFSGKYSFSNVYNDYTATVANNWTTREQKQTDLISLDPKAFVKNNRTTRKVISKVQVNDSTVRNFAVKHSLEHFKEYRNKYDMRTRYLSLFKYINNNFNYVPDSQRDEYFATPKETISNGLGGDCDDHSILMASAMMSIGAKCRLVMIEGHMYPELYIGDKDEFEIYQQAILQLFKQQNIDKMYYHENNGEFWLNLDYSARHPGGPYLNDKVYAIIDL